MRGFGHLRGAVVAVAASAALVATGVGAGGASASSVAKVSAVEPQATTGSVIKYAESPGANPNYILPLTTSATQSLYNIDQFFNLMWPLLYLPTPSQPTLDYGNSMAYAPVWSDNDTVVTVTMKHYVWSDGTPVSARDVVFYVNELKAMGPTWGGYGGPTQFPFNVKTVTATNATTVKFVLTAKVNPTYFDDNGLDDIYVIPQHAWDKTSVNGAVGNYDMTASGAKAVFNFLTKQAQDTTTYTTNPLWKVVDGPWELQSFGGASSPDIFVPNPTYSGPKAKVSEFEEIPFTSDAAEFTALKAGTVNYGAIPTQDIPTIPSIKSEGYNVTAVPTWGFDFMMPNFANPAVGPILNQLYIRQAFAHLMDQNTQIKHFMDGYATPVYGPAPVYPLGNPFVTNDEKTNPYPFSISTAESILKAHGWKVDPGGVDSCQTVGTGPSDCGAGITAGEKLSINLLWATGLEISQEIVDLFQSDAAQAGVQINPKGGTFDSVLGVAEPCVLPKGKGTPACGWQLVFWGGVGLATYPSGEGIFNTGGGLNVGSYSNPTLDKYINESTVASTLSAFDQYENLVVQQAVWLWTAIPDNIFATSKGLSGYGLTSEFCGGFNYIEPQFWSISS
jgi:peptide/nickel transport system substrate-binding protein